jgi:ABC-type lipoprotein release transport system permease subunit
VGSVQTLQMAWRNLWRNRRRTVITLAAVSLNTAILILTFALMEGLLRQTTDNATQLATGEVELHAPGYLSDRSLYKVLSHPQEVLKRLSKDRLNAVPRVYGYGLVSQGTKSAGALFWGVEPDAERRVFKLPKHLLEGRFLSPETPMNIVLGKKLARSLNAQVGSELVVVVQGADGSLGNDLFTVCGILKAAGDVVDRNAAIIRMSDFRNLFVLPQGTHEIAVNTRGAVPLERLRNLVGELAPGAEVKTWQDLLPVLSDMLHISNASMVVFAAIFFIAGGLGVMNTMLMATYERIPEFGVLKALGATPWRIVRDVCTEAWLLAAVATILGALVGVGASLVLQRVGLDTSSYAGAETTIAGVAFDPIWRAAFRPAMVVRTVLPMWIMCVLAALYPAALAARLDPVKSMTHV